MGGSWDFERVLLVIMLLLVLGALGFMGWESYVAGQLADGLSEAENDLAEIGQVAQQVKDLSTELRNDQMTQTAGPREYLERQMVDSMIGKTRFDQPKATSAEAEDWIDTHYKLTPVTSSPDFTRQQLAHFLLYIEGNTTRMKVTNIHLELSNKRDAGADGWRPTVTVTNRHPKPSKAP